MEKEQKTHPVLSVKDVLLLIVGALLVIVIFQNIKPRVFRILFWPCSVSPVLLMLIMIGAGILAGYLIARCRFRARAEKAAAKAAPSTPKPPDSGSLPAA